MLKLSSTSFNRTTRTLYVEVPCARQLKFDSLLARIRAGPRRLAAVLARLPRHNLRDAHLCGARVVGGGRALGFYFLGGGLVVWTLSEKRPRATCHHFFVTWTLPTQNLSGFGRNLQPTLSQVSISLR